jgi:hypothetical protein
MTLMFAFASTLACVFIAHVCRLYRSSVRCARARASVRRQCSVPRLRAVVGLAGCWRRRDP